MNQVRKSRLGSAGLSVMQQLGRSVVTRAGLSREAELSVHRALHVPLLTYGR